MRKTSTEWATRQDTCFDLKQNTRKTCFFLTPSAIIRSWNSNSRRSKCIGYSHETDLRSIKWLACRCSFTSKTWVIIIHWHWQWWWSILKWGMSNLVFEGIIVEWSPAAYHRKYVIGTVATERMWQQTRLNSIVDWAASKYFFVLMENKGLHIFIPQFHLLL